LKHSYRSAIAGLLALGTMLVARPVHAATTYYVSASTGSDSNAGTSSGAPWQTLAKVNGHSFVAGDSILFKSGDAWTGQLAPTGSGSSAAHIVVNSYNTGAQPIINGAGAQPSAVYIHNLAYWEVRNLSVTNTGVAGGQYVGIEYRNDTGGPLSYVYVGGNTVSNVNGIPSAAYPNNGGICIDAGNSASWNTVTVENNTITNCDRIGVYVGAMLFTTPVYATNVLINNNTMTNIGGDGILLYFSNGGTVQNNTLANSGSRSTQGGGADGWQNTYAAGMWCNHADNSIFQGNEVYGNLGGGDGEAYDIDLTSNGTVMQANYGHDNPNGFMFFCDDATTTVYVRNNLSVNDGGTASGSGGALLNFAYGGPTCYVTNNTFYVKSSLATAVTKSNPTVASYVKNNIFYMLGTTSYGTTNETWDYNLFYGTHPGSEPTDAHKLTSDPQFQLPGQDLNGKVNSTGYKLLTGSPAIGSGTNLGATILGSLDYYGNTISTSAAPNRGAYDGTGVAPVIPPAPTGVNASAGNAQISLAWTSGGGTSFNVYRGTAAGAESTTAIATGIATTNYTNTGLANGTTYFYKVKAVNSAGTSGYSNEASATPTAAANLLTNPGFETGSLSSWTVWSPNGTGSAANVEPNNPHTGSYNAYEWATGAFQVDLSENNIAVPNGTYTMTGWVWAFSLPSNSCYMYAKNSGGSGPPAAIITASGGYVQYTITNIVITGGLCECGFFSDGLANQGIRIDDVTLVASGSSAPAAPTGLVATAGNTQVALSWTASSGATTYNVYRGTSAGGESTTAIATGIGTTTYTNTGLTNGTTYYYKVTAVNASGTSGYSNEASATPAAPTNYIQNPGFENGFTSWTVWSPNGTGGAANWETNNPHTGTHNAYEWSTSAFNVDLSENAITVPNGTYTMTAWVWSSGGQNSCYMYAKNPGGAGGSVIITSSSGYTLYTLTGVVITSGQCEAGFVSDGNANNFLRIDDVTLTMN